MNPFKDWLKTENGKICNDFSTLKGQPYLENRLYHAYSAGMISEYSLYHKQIKTYQDTIDWYEQKKRQSEILINELKATIESLEAEQKPQRSESEQP